MDHNYLHHSCRDNQTRDHISTVCRCILHCCISSLSIEHILRYSPKLYAIVITLGYQIYIVHDKSKIQLRRRSYYQNQIHTTIGFIAVIPAIIDIVTYVMIFNTISIFATEFIQDIACYKVVGDIFDLICNKNLFLSNFITYRFITFYLLLLIFVLSLIQFSLILLTILWILMSEAMKYSVYYCPFQRQGQRCLA